MVLLPITLILHRKTLDLFNEKWEFPIGGICFIRDFIIWLTIVARQLFLAFCYFIYSRSLRPFTRSDKFYRVNKTTLTFPRPFQLVFISIRLMKFFVPPERKGIVQSIPSQGEQETGHWRVDVLRRRRCEGKCGKERQHAVWWVATCSLPPPCVWSSSCRYYCLVYFLSRSWQGHYK